ncbi:hypothetical protein AVEN_107733-1 [Araneus ventricosus]|uniref:Uncharacterized protein n=1 Tax=Araneus ventricosus TaxID=182803 RepID=A0A4Y2IXY2_ARAVE|nr:hypothetical protein AVEN_107733-1 [Araneus ventricosus]
MGSPPEIGRKSVHVKAPEGLHVSVGTPAVDGVGERQWESQTADRHFASVGMCTCSHSSLHSTKGMRTTDFKSIDTQTTIFAGRLENGLLLQAMRS